MMHGQNHIKFVRVCTYYLYILDGAKEICPCNLKVFVTVDLQTVFHIYKICSHVLQVNNYICSHDSKLRDYKNVIFCATSYMF